MCSLGNNKYKNNNRCHIENYGKNMLHMDLFILKMQFHRFLFFILHALVGKFSKISRAFFFQFVQHFEVTESRGHIL